MLNLLPGPVDSAPGVREALAAAPESHRSRAFTEDLTDATALFRNLTGAPYAALLLGSGTLANDVIAAQLSLDRSAGLILSNGEFGERLLDHARRFQLPFDELRRPWGRSFEMLEVERRLGATPRPAWVWCVHVETSTGVRNDLEGVAALCHSHGVRLCLDAVSSIGTIAVDLSQVHLASSVSGKGLRSLAGIAIVSHDHPVQPSLRLPRYLDLGLYAAAGVPFTHSSNLVKALGSAMRDVNWPERHAEVARISAWLRKELRAAGFQVVASEANAAPGIVTLSLPRAIDSTLLGDHLEELGYRVACHSGYLRTRNWIQISLMALPREPQLEGLIDALAKVCRNATHS